MIYLPKLDGGREIRHRDGWLFSRLLFRLLLSGAASAVFDERSLIGSLTEEPIRAQAHAAAGMF